METGPISNSHHGTHVRGSAEHSEERAVTSLCPTEIPRYSCCADVFCSGDWHQWLWPGKTPPSSSFHLAVPLKRYRSESSAFILPYPILVTLCPPALRLYISLVFL